MSAETIRQRLAAATPAPWDAEEGSGTVWAGPASVVQIAYESGRTKGDAALIAHAPTDLALLLAAVEAAQVVAERLACNHVFDPECARCEWLSPLRRALERVEAGE